MLPARRLNMSRIVHTLQLEASRRLWVRGALWLAVLGPLLVLSCNFAQSVAEARQIQGSIVFEWESWIPFRPWTILPCWTLYLAYILSFFIPGDALSLAGWEGGQTLSPEEERARLDRHGERVLLCQLMALAFFLLVPLRFSYTPPRVEGFLGLLFAASHFSDQQYNQIPVLPIALLVLIGARWRPEGVGRAVFNTWAFLVTVSFLTTWQYHFTGVAAGLLLGCFVLWCVPDEGPTLRTLWREGVPAEGDSRRLGWTYYAGALACFIWACCGWLLWGSGAGGLWLFLIWVGVSLMLAGLACTRLGPRAFRKRGGRFPASVRWLFLPHLVGAWLNSRWWTRHHPEPDHVADRVWIGRMPGRREMKRIIDRERTAFEEEAVFDALLDLTAELPVPLCHDMGDVICSSVPLHDFTLPLQADVIEAVRRLDALYRAGRTTLVCCALGTGPSAMIVAVWLAFRSGAELEEAIAGVCRRRQGIVLSEEQRLVAQAALRALREEKRAEELAERIERWRAAEKARQDTLQRARHVYD